MPSFSLNAVRVFVIAAQHLSFVKAAKALYVTPGAVSQTVRQLEEDLGVALFERLTRQLKLTERGMEFLQAVEHPLQEIAWAAERIRPKSNRVDISVLPSFASCWLMPRLFLFTQQHPDIQVRVAASMEPANLETDRIDLGVRHTNWIPPKLLSHQLFEDKLYPVCSPQYLASMGGEINWKKAMLLHENTTTEEHISTELWDSWLMQHHQRNSSQNPSMYFSFAMLAIAAALNHQGIALLFPQYIQRELAENKLIICNPVPLIQEGGLYLVWSKRQPQQTVVKAFADWLTHEMHKTNESIAAFTTTTAPE